MNWTTALAVGLFVVACLWAISKWRAEDWHASRKVGTGTFLFGAALGLFHDELLGTTPAILQWAELLGAGLMITAVVVSRTFRPS